MRPAPTPGRWPRLVGLALLAVGSLLVYLVAWQLITGTVATDLDDRPGSEPAPAVEDSRSAPRPPEP